MSALFDAVIRGSIRKRHLVLVAAAGMVVFGAWSVRRAQLDALPSFTPPMVVVQAEARGLGSAAVERLVTTPLEQLLLGTPGVERVRSTSSPGLSVVQMTFSEGSDIFRARQLVSELLAQARARLPAELPPPRLAPITAPVGALLKFAYTASGGGRAALAALRRFGAWKLRPRLRAIHGVSRVIVHGAAASRIEVRPDPAAMVGRGVALADLRRALATAQSLSPLGYAKAGPQREPLRADGLWSVAGRGAIAQTVVSARGGLPVRVADVAQVALGTAPPVGSALYDGAPAVYVQIDKLPWADTLRVTERVEAALKELDAALPAGARRSPPVFRQADFIRTSLLSVGRAMAIGGAFVIVVLFALLRSGRLALISLSALPLSMIAAVAVLLARGVTIDGMILGGLAIAVGEVVDDAIVDVENIWRRLRDNAASQAPRPALEVIHDASAEVRGAVVYASLIVIVVLLPVLVLGGVAGRIFSPLAEAYMLSVAASLLVALTVTPALSAILLPRLARTERNEPRLTRWLRRGYDRALAPVQRWPGRIVVLSAGLGVGALAVLPWLGGGFLPEFREGVLIAEVTAWPGTSLEETTRLASRLSAELRRDAAIAHVAARVGRASLDEDAAPVHRMEIDLALARGAGDPEDVARRAIARMSALPGVRFTIDGFLGERINELLSGERAPVALKLYGSDLRALRRAARRLMTRIGDIPGVESVRCAGLADAPTLDLRIDEVRLAIAGLRRADVVAGAAAWTRGLVVAEVKSAAGVSVPLAIAADRQQPARGRLASLPVFTRSSVLPLSSLVDLVESSEPPAIHHDGGRRLITVTARAKTAELSEVADQIERLAGRELGSGLSWVLAGQAAERAHAGVELAITVALVLAGVMVFLWMAFGSLVDAGVVLGGLPLGLVGGVLGALLLPEGLSMAGLVGFVALAGIVSRNALMLVAHKNDLAAQAGAASEDVVLRAARERLLPIVMTAATAFFGLLPLAASIGAAGSELEAPMAFIVCGGLVTSTALNLVAVPAFFVWRAQRRARRQDGGGSSNAGAAEPSP